MKALFATYSSSSKQSGQISFLGVLKRCLRLIKYIDLPKTDLLLLNFGEFPMDDPLFQEVLPKITVLKTNFEEYNNLSLLMERTKPDVVVLGEGPGSGKMLEVSKAALKLEIPQVCIENYYGKSHPQHFKKENPWLDQWLLLGLPIENSYGRIAGNAVLIPPLLPSTQKVSETRQVDITILGYDLNVAFHGLELLRKLPDNLKSRLIYSKSTHTHLADFKQKSNGQDVEFCSLPSDQKLNDCFTNSKIVVCKSGFQQIVECLAKGTPVMLFDATGGVPEILLPKHLKPYVQYFPKNSKNWSKMLLQASLWLCKKPQMPWVGEINKIESPSRFGADQLTKVFAELCKTGATVL